MKTTILIVSAALLLCAGAIGQAPLPDPGANVMYFQQPGPGDPAAAHRNVFVRTDRMGDKMTAEMIAMSDFDKPVTGAPYSATATTETIQVLADGNRIVNKTEAQIARDAQGRTRREETMSNIGPLVTNVPKMVFIMDPVARVNYILDLNTKTANVMKVSPPVKIHVTSGTRPDVQPDTAKPLPPPPGTTVNVEKKVIVNGPNAGVEQRVFVYAGEDSGQVKSESLGTQVIEGVSAEGMRTTRTIPAGQIGNERALEITSEVWTSPELQMIVLSKRNDPRFGETIYRLTDVRRAEPDPSLFQLPSGFTTKGGEQ